MLKIGKTQTLEVLRSTSVGLFLGDNEDAEVLLPQKYVPANAQVGDELKVFVYKDSLGRIIATTLVPFAEVGQFACLTVKQLTKPGAFVDLGLEKDLLVPYQEQSRSMNVGNKYIVYVYLDERSDRLVGSTKVNHFLKNQDVELREGEEVELLARETTDLGLKLIVNNTYEGLVHTSKLFRDVKLGERLTGFVENVREDGKIDIALEKGGFKRIEKTAADLLAQITAKGGFIPLTDKSDPEEIKSQLQISKKTFKKAVGTLYKARLIRLEEDGIHLN